VRSKQRLPPASSKFCRTKKYTFFAIFALFPCL
jgi:hypothetical protein